MALCKLGEILTLATDEEQEVLADAIFHRQADTGNFTWSAKALANAINKTTFNVGSTTIKEHRRKTCGCY